MTYLERKFNRDLLLTFVFTEAALVAFLGIAHAFQGHPVAPRPESISLSAPLAIGAFPAGILAMVLGGSFARLNILVDLMWTRPISRVRLAFSVIALHLGTIVLAWLASIVILGLTPMVLFGGFPAGSLRFDDNAERTFFALLASLIGVYGLVVGTLFAYRSRSALTMRYAALFAGMGTGGLAVLTLIPMVDTGQAAVKVAFGGPISAAKALAQLQAGSVFEPIWPSNIVAYTLLWLTIGVAGIAITTFSWRRVEF